MRIHDLRHSAVAILIAQGVIIKAISELLGHSSVAFTLQVYGHLIKETKRETADKMDAPLSPIPGCYQCCYQTGYLEGELTRKFFRIWCARRDSNSRPTGSKPAALST
jgi:hypothetical protein